ncbi:MAG: oligosaccharide flippase family protein [Candidatus Anstonellaceae archaeon]
MTHLKQSVINIISSLIGYVIPMVINFFITPFLLYFLGENAFGLQSLFFLIIGYLTIMDMGLDLAITKYLAEDYTKKDIDSMNNLLNTSLILYYSIGIIWAFILLISSPYLAKNFFQIPNDLINEAINVFNLTGIGFLGSMGISWARAVCMGLNRFDLYYFVLIIFQIISAFIGVGMVYMGYGVTGYVATRVLFNLIACIFYFFIINYYLPDFKLKLIIKKVTITRMATYLKYGVINRFTGIIMSKIDQTFISIWLGISSFGIYSVVLLVVNSISYMIAYMMGFILPLSSELQTKGDIKKLRNIFLSLSKFSVILSNIFFIPLFVFADKFLILWVPSIADKAFFVFRLLIISAYISTLTTAISNSIMIGLGKIREFTTYTVIRAILLTIFCIILIKPYGLEGAGLALFFVCFVDIVYFKIFCRYYLKLEFIYVIKNTFLKPILLGIIMATILFLIHPFVLTWIEICLMIGISSFVYLIICFLVGILGEIEKNIILNFWELIKRNLIVKMRP